MKRTFWNITLASLITLVAYILLFGIWGAILNGVKNETLRLFLIALMTSCAFGFFLLYTAKIRRSVGADELELDYENCAYSSVKDDFKLIIRRELKVFVCIGIIVLICFALNTVDRVFFEKKVISFPTFFFTSMTLFGTFIKIPFLGYAVSAAVNFLAYIIFLLIYRKKKVSQFKKLRSENPYG